MQNQFIFLFLLDGGQESNNGRHVLMCSFYISDRSERASRKGVRNTILTGVLTSHYSPYIYAYFSSPLSLYYSINAPYSSSYIHPLCSVTASLSFSNQEWLAYLSSSCREFSQTRCKKATSQSELLQNCYVARSFLQYLLISVFLLVR